MQFPARPAYARCLSVGLALAVAVGLPAASITRARAESADAFTSALPSRDTARPEGVSAASAAGGVAEQQGTATYSVPLELPEGRQGMAPELALTYSSAGALRGGLAVGWDVHLPSIERDPDFPTQRRYRSSLGGGWVRLIENSVDPGSGARYRAELDDGSFALYALEGNVWTVKTTDGITRTFGKNDPESRRWALTSERDPFGNEVKYVWASEIVGWGSTVYIDWRLSRIEWTSNTAASLQAHAKVEVVYAARESCGGLPVGARLDSHFTPGSSAFMYGSRRVTSFDVSVRDTAGGAWRMSRRYALGYDTNELACGNRTPLRYLTSITTTGWNAAGVATTMPPVTFGYGPFQRSFGGATALGAVGRGDFGTYTGAEGTLMDLDGDGVPDRVWMETGARCTLKWSKGDGTGRYATTVQTAQLPTADWLGTDHGFDAPANDEWCSLGGQVSRRPSDYFQTPDGEWLACRTFGVNASYHFMDVDQDGLVDLLVNLHESQAASAGRDFPATSLYSDNDNGGGNTQCPQGMESSGDGECACPGGLRYEPNCGCVEPCPAGTQQDFLQCGVCNECTSSNAYCTDTGGGGWGGGDQPPACEELRPQPEQFAGSYVWRVFRNQGGGQLAGLSATGVDMSAAVVVQSPKALAANGSEMTVGAGRLHENQPPTLIDINGDGWLDVVSTSGAGSSSTPALGSSTSPRLHVWPGGPWPAGFGPEQIWTMPSWDAANEGTYSGGDGRYYRRTTTSFVDLNVDGLPDIVTEYASGAIHVLYNQIGSFAAPVPLGLQGDLDLARMDLTGTYDENALRSGAHGFERRFMDLDSDGLPELVMFSTASGGLTAPPSGRALVRMSGGTPYSVTNLDPVYDVTRAVIVAADGSWYRNGDLIDVTGDGLPDALTWQQANATLRTDLPSAAPLRLLERVDNGRGGTTRFEYTASNRHLVLGPGERLAPRWLVTAVIDAPGFGQPEVRTGYAYAGPRHGVETALQPTPAGFLGFAQVTTTRSGQHGFDSTRTVKDYGVPPLPYGRDRRLHLLAETVYGRDGDGVERRVRRTEHTYANEHLLTMPAGAGLPSFTYEQRTIDRTYAADGATEAGVRSTTHGWAARYRGAVKMLLVHEETREGVGESPTTTRLTTRQFQTRFLQSPYATTDYRVLETTVVTYLATPYFPIAIARDEILPDVATGLPLESRTYQSTTVFGSTVRTFDPLTGNVLTVKRPSQPASGGAKVTYVYDGHALKVQSTTNEVGHLVVDSYDHGTGALVRREGPNRRFVARTGCTGLFCFSLVPEVETFTVDGLGRVLDHWGSTDPLDGSAGFVQKPLESFAYHDFERPVRRVHHRNLAFDTTVLVTDEDRFDGAGRLLSRTAKRQLNGQPDAITSYTYDAGGEVVRVDQPDPRVDTGATVAYHYLRDGLGRVTRFGRPDGNTEVVRYDGLTARIQELSDTDGAGAETTTIRDVFDRLVEVREHDTPAPDAPATAPGVDAITTYGYDWLDRVSSIRDADGNVTSLHHDWAGNRVTISRGSRTWSYRYDAGNNLVAVVAPRPASAAEADYTSINTYDAMDRLVTHTPATRGLSLDRRAALGIGPVTYAYDTNAPGKITQVTLPFGTISLTYDARGQVKREQRTIRLPGFTRTQWVERATQPLGGPTMARWDDATSWSWEYDRRGQVSALRWRNPSTSVLTTPASYVRAVSGHPRLRGGDWDQRRQWSYDALARVVHDRVWRPSNNQTLGERSYGYDGFGELRAIAGATHTLSADAVYDYDARGRLRRAEGPHDYDATFAYSLAGNVHRATVGGALDVPDRDVRYRYGAVDPQAVDALVDETSGQPVATLTYDLAGNMIGREVDAGRYDLTWDGDDKLREVAGPGGTEIYWFGPGGERIAAIGATTIKLWFGESETQYNRAGAQLVRYHHVAAGEPLVRFTNGSPAEQQYADALQNLMLAVAPNGAVTAAFVYGGFGEVVGQTGQEDHRRRFNGKEHDAVSGLRHYGYRSYDPLLLRWVSADPLYRFVPDQAWAEPQRANLYAFSLNNPLRYVDPDGRDAKSDEAKAKYRKKIAAAARVVVARQERARANTKALKKKLQDAKRQRKEDPESGPTNKELKELERLHQASWNAEARLQTEYNELEALYDAGTIVGVRETAMKQHPKFLAKNIGVLERGDVAQPIEVKGDWYKIRTQHGVEGWINQAWIQFEVSVDLTSEEGRGGLDPEPTESGLSAGRN